MKHIITVNGREITLTHEEARELYEQLKELFEQLKREAKPMPQEIVDRIFTGEPGKHLPFWEVRPHRKPLTRDFGSHSTVTVGGCACCPKGDS